MRRASPAGLAVLGVALIASTAQAEEEDVLRVVSIDTSRLFAPAIVVAVPELLPGQVLGPAAFAVLDDNGPRPIDVEHLSTGQLDGALVIDTAADVPMAALAAQQAAGVELLRHLQGAGELGMSTSTARAFQPPTADGPETFSFLAGLRPEGDRHFGSGLSDAMDHLRHNPSRRRAIIVTSAGDADLTSLAETTLLAERLVAHDVQVFWLVMAGAPPPIVQQLVASGVAVTLVEGKLAAAAADHVAAALQAQYRVSVELLVAVGPIRLRVDVNGALHEISLDGATGAPPLPAPPSTTPVAAQPTPAPVATLPAVPEAADPIVSAPAEVERRTVGEHEFDDGTSATWWALVAFASIAGTTTLGVVVASTSTAVGRRRHPVPRPSPPTGHLVSWFRAPTVTQSKREKDDMDKLVVVGQGYVGLPLAVRAAEVGFRVVGLDVDEFRIKRVASGESFVAEVTDERLDAVLRSGCYTITDEPRKCAGFDYAVISVPTPLKVGCPDLSFIEDAARNLARFVRPGSTVVLESSTYPGTTEEVVLPLLEDGSGLTAGEDFYLGYSPERIDPGNTRWTLVTTPKIVSGIDAESLRRVDAFYRHIVERTVPVSRPSEAELAKLLENTFRHVNIALVNEIAMLAHELGVDIWQSLDAAATKPFGFMRFDPGPGVGGHCLPVDPSYLSWRLRHTLGQPSRFIELANDINTGMPTYVVNRLVLALNERSLSVKGRNILLLGLSYKKNTGDARESPARAIARRLVALGADVSAADPCLHEADVPAGVSLVDLSDTALASADAVVLLVDHDQFDYETISNCGRIVLDCRRVLCGPTVEAL